MTLFNAFELFIPRKLPPPILKNVVYNWSDPTSESTHREFGIQDTADFEGPKRA